MPTIMIPQTTATFNTQFLAIITGIAFPLLPLDQVQNCWGRKLGIVLKADLWYDKVEFE